MADLVANESAYDVVVVGCGVAGLSCAVSAAEDGASVVVLERAKREERGGNSAYTEAYLRLNDAQHVADHFVDDMLSLSEGYTEAEIVNFFAKAIPPTLDWVQTHGVKIVPLATNFLTKSRPRMQPAGGGLAMVEALCASAERLGVTFLYETTAEELIRNEEGRIVGVRARARGRGLTEILGQAVVLACGGYGGNPEMMAQYVGRNAHRLRPIAPGGYFNKGEGIRMALAVGAQPSGQFDEFHAEPIDPRATKEEPAMMCFPYGILVDEHALRFVDEGPTTVDQCYEAVARTIFRLPKSVAYFISDAQFYEVPDYQRSMATDQPLVEAQTLGELAAKLGLPEAQLLETVAQYNAACQPGKYNALALDGVSTRGLQPPKSNWALPIDRAPFVASPIACSVVFTYGGVKVNTSSQVIDTDGNPIAGLYAAGEVIGMYYHSYPGATSVLRGLVFGRAAWLGANILAPAKASV